MTSLGNIELIKKDIFNSGVAFELNKASDVDDIIDFENGWQAEIRVGIQYLVVRGVLAELTYEEVYRVSYNYAQKFLDLLSVCKITKINLKNHTSSFLIWWRNKDGQNLQVRDIMMKMDVIYVHQSHQVIIQVIAIFDCPKSLRIYLNPLETCISLLKTYFTILHPKNPERVRESGLSVD